MAPRIVGGSNYDNPYAQPVGFDPFADKIFEAFDDSQKELRAEEIRDDPLGEIKAEFQEAQRRQSAPRPRKGFQT